MLRFDRSSRRAGSARCCAGSGKSACGGSTPSSCHPQERPAERDQCNNAAEPAPIESSNGCSLGIANPRLHSFAGVRRNDTDLHKRRMRSCPGYCLLFRFEITVDDQSTAFLFRVTLGTRGLSAYHRRPGIHCGQLISVHYHLTAIGNLVRVDGTMTVLQWNAIPACGAGLILTPPINSNSRGYCPFGGPACLDKREQSQSDSNGFHSSSQRADTPVYRHPQFYIANDSQGRMPLQSSPSYCIFS